MQLRRAGAAGLPVTPVGLGLAALGRPGYITEGRAADLGEDRSPERLEAQAHSVLDAAWDAGVRYFDAARSYGRAEAFLARWLERWPDRAAAATAVSKWGYRYTAGWRVDADVHEVKDHGIDTLRTQLAETRALLGDRLAAYQIHSATLETGVLDDAEVLGELAALRRHGVVVGFTSSGPRQADVIRRGIDAQVDGERLFGLVQATWNPLEPSAGEALSAASDAGLVVVVKEALANGRLTARGDVGADGALAGIARRRAVSADAVAIAAALSQPWCDVVLSGAVRPEQLRSNVAGAGLALDSEELATLATLAEPAEAYWRVRSARSWR